LRFNLPRKINPAARSVNEIRATIRKKPVQTCGRLLKKAQRGARFWKPWMRDQAML